MSVAIQTLQAQLKKWREDIGHEFIFPNVWTRVWTRLTGQIDKSQETYQAFYSQYYLQVRAASISNEKSCNELEVESKVKTCLQREIDWYAALPWLARWSTNYERVARVRLLQWSETRAAARQLQNSLSAWQLEQKGGSLSARRKSNEALLQAVSQCQKSSRNLGGLGRAHWYPFALKFRRILFGIQKTFTEANQLNAHFVVQRSSLSCKAATEQLKIDPNYFAPAPNLMPSPKVARVALNIEGSLSCD